MRSTGRWACVVILTVFASCGGKQKDEPDSPSVSDGGPAPDPTRLARTVLSLEFSEVPSMPPTSEVSVVMTDENGASRREAVGSWPGVCRRVADASPGGAMKGQLMRAECPGPESGGVELRFVRRKWELHVLEARFDNANDERSFEQRGAVKLPEGDKVEVAPPAE